MWFFFSFVSFVIFVGFRMIWKNMPKAESMCRKSEPFEDLNQDGSVISVQMLNYSEFTFNELYKTNIMKIQMYFSIFLKIALTKCHFTPPSSPSQFCHIAFPKRPGDGEHMKKIQIKVLPSWMGLSPPLFPHFLIFYRSKVNIAHSSVLFADFAYGSILSGRGNTLFGTFCLLYFKAYSS